MKKKNVRKSKFSRIKEKNTPANFYTGEKKKCKQRSSKENFETVRR